MSNNYRFFETPIKILDKTTSGLNGNVKQASLFLQGGLFIDNTSDATSVNDGGSFTSHGGVSIQKNLLVGDKVRIYSTEESINLSSGALVVSGGLAVQKTLAVGGLLTMSGTQKSTNATTGAFVSNGGISIATTEDATSLTSGGH